MILLKWLATIWISIIGLSIGFACLLGAFNLQIPFSIALALGLSGLLLFIVVAIQLLLWTWGLTWKDFEYEWNEFMDS